MPLIKRYPNRKLYDTEEKRYITLEQISEMIRNGEEVRVIDNTNGDDMTAVTLTQIIFAQEKKHGGLLHRSMLRNLIQAGEDRISGLQHSLSQTLAARHQVDEEIKQRIQSLVEKKEISVEEGTKWTEKLVPTSASYPNETNILPERFQISFPNLEKLLKLRQIPTHADLDQLNRQLEELSVKLDEFEPPASNQGDHSK